MVRKFIKPIVAVVLCAVAVFLIVEGFVAWGVIAAVISALMVFLYFKNEKNLLAFFFVRKNNFAKADMVLSMVKNPENMIKSQEAYFYYLSGLTEGQKQVKGSASKSEKLLKKALSSGLRMKSDQAMAKLSLAGIYLSQRNKKLATYYIKETKKLDTRKMLAEQIKEVEKMMKRI